RVLRIHEAPQIDVTLVKSLEPPGGIGEPGTSCVMPALTNAIFAATGKRIRKLPVANQVQETASSRAGGWRRGSGKLHPPATEALMSADDEVDEARLTQVLAEVPRGSVVVAGTAVAIVVAIWFAFYFFAFLPRGPIG